MTDLGTKESITVPGFTGLGETAIPKGRWKIIELSSDQQRHPDWLGLYGDRDPIFNDLYREFLPGKRKGFRLHKGVRSAGCITVPKETHSDAYDRLQNLIENTRVNMRYNKTTDPTTDRK